MGTFMPVIAFIHDDYDDVGVADNFRGHYKDIEEALNLLRGGRFGTNNNLEIMDVETFGWRHYRWKPDYKYRDGFEENEDAVQ